MGKKKYKNRIKYKTRRRTREAKSRGRTKETYSDPLLDKFFLLFTDYYLRQKSELVIVDSLETNFPDTLSQRLQKGLSKTLTDYSQKELKTIADKYVSLTKKEATRIKHNTEEEHKKVADEVEHFLTHQKPEVQAAFADPSLVDELVRYPERNLLLSSTLVTLISDLDSYISSLFLFFFKQPIEADKIMNQSDKKYSWKDINGKTSEEIKSEAIDNYVRSIMDGSFSSQIRTFKANEINVRNVNGCNLTEKIEQYHTIRNRFVHANGICDSATYNAIKNVSDNIITKEGHEIQLNKKFLNEVADATFEMSVQLLVSLSNKMLNQTSKIYMERYVVNRTYYLLVDRRYELAKNISNLYANSPSELQSSTYIMKVNGWIAQKELGRFGDIKSEVEQWDTTAADDRYKLAKMCLLGYNEKALDLASKMVKEGRLQFRHWITWPLFKELRLLDKEKHKVVSTNK